MGEADLEVLTVLDRQTNHWVVRVPNRSHPGLIIQGDSLKILYDLADEIHERTLGSGEVGELASELLTDLRGRLEAYEQAVRRHGLQLPYSRPISEK